jgi:hypothetical protein
MLVPREKQVAPPVVVDDASGQELSASSSDAAD